MITFKRAFLLLILVAFASLLSSCATTQEENPNQVSTQPWNRPQKWEGPGTLGGMMNTF